MPENRRLPFLIAFSNVIVFTVIGLFQVLLKTPIYYVVPQDIIGYDYRDFYYASSALAKGESPYSVSRYVTPPLPAVANLIFLPFGFELARNVFLTLIPLLIFLSYLIIYLTLKFPGSRSGDWLLLSGLFLIATSYPFYFLLERGNIDGVVLFCICAGLSLLPKKTWLGGFLLAVASLLKLYPLLIPVSLLFSRRWKPLLWTCTWLFVLTLLTGSYWSDYFASSYQRSYYFRLDENGSLANTIMIILIFLQVIFTGDIRTIFEQSSTIMTAVIYGVTVITLLYCDYKTPSNATQKEYVSNALLYFPLMVAIPQTVYHYEFVLLIPLLPVLTFLWGHQLSTSQRYCLVLIAVGIALSQWHAIALYVITDNMLAQYIPGFGLLLVIVHVFIYRFLSLRELGSNSSDGDLRL